MSETTISVATIDESFPHHWQAAVLQARPAILPARHYVYPQLADEVERGALEVMVRPGNVNSSNPSGAPGPSHFWTREGFQENPKGISVSYQGMTSVMPKDAEKKEGASAPEGYENTHQIAAQEVSGHDRETHPVDGSRAAPAPIKVGALTPEQNAQPFLATCALGFRDPAVPTGLWSTPKPEEICAVSGGYAYIINTTAPERFSMIPYRPVLEVRPAVEAGLLLFVGHRSILAWGRDGLAWESDKLSDEGVTITTIENGVLRGMGWQMMTDKETEFVLDLRNGQRNAPPCV